MSLPSALVRIFPVGLDVAGEPLARTGNSTLAGAIQNIAGAMDSWARIVVTGSTACVRKSKISRMGD